MAQDNQENPSGGLEAGSADQIPPALTTALPTNLGRLLNEEEMITLKSRCEGYMACGTNFQVPVENEPPPPDFSNVNPQVRVERGRRAKEDSVVEPSQRKAYKQGFEEACRLLMEKLR